MSCFWISLIFYTCPLITSINATLATPLLIFDILNTYHIFFINLTIKNGEILILLKLVK